MTEDSKKLYRVDWRHTSPLAPGEFFEEYVYIAAESEVAATTDLFGTDFKVREATIEEMEAYVRGYEDGYDVDIINERMSQTSTPISLEDLKDL